MAIRIYPLIPMDLIQSVRLIHALMESDFEICIPRKDKRKFTVLRRQFGAHFTLGIKRGAVPFPDLIVSHEEPRTAVGSVERPLIFPHAVVARCHGLWPAQKRGVRFSFAGLLTASRLLGIGEWTRRNVAADTSALEKLSAWHGNFGQRIAGCFGIAPRASAIQVGDLLLWQSARGRTFPTKAWDRPYFELLSRSQFVLCPNGDFVWSYRFFEAVLCGAIPIVEETSPVYRGFSYLRMTDDSRDAAWDANTAEDNYWLAVQRLTVPTRQLNCEMDRLLKRRKRDAFEKTGG